MAQTPIVTLKMRCNRVSIYESGGSTLREIQLVSSDRTGVQLDPSVATNAGLTASLTLVGEGDAVFDQTFDVTITPVEVPA